MHEFMFLSKLTNLMKIEIHNLDSVHIPNLIDLLKTVTKLKSLTISTI